MGADELRAGARVGEWLLERPLGRGGMGVVWLARDRAGRPAALKLLLEPGGAGAEAARARARFSREVHAALALRDPHLVGFLGAGEAEGVPWIALEYCPGGSLQDVLRRPPGRLPWRDAARVGIALAEALRALHAAGLVHRDLKPGNVLLDEAGRPRLADLGLIRREPGQASQDLTRTGEVVGTPEYLAPEQIDGGPVDGRADLYALGCTLFALLSGAPPFRGHAVQLLHQHLHTSPPRLRELVPGVPPRLERLVARLLDKDPARRGDAPSVAAELRGVLAERASPRRKLLAAVSLLVALAGARWLWPAPGGPPPASERPASARPAEAAPAASGQLAFLRRSAQPHRGPVTALLLAEGGVVTASADGQLLRWDGEALQRSEAPGLPGAAGGPILCGLRGPAGQLLLGGEGRILELDRAGRSGGIAREAQVMGEAAPPIPALARRGEEWLLGLASGRGVLLHDAPHRQPEQLLAPDLRATPLLAAYLPDERRLLVRPDAAYVFDADDPRNHSDIVADEAPWTAAALHPSGRELLVGDARGHVGLMSLARNTMSPLPRPLHPAAVTAAAFHPDGRRCLTADREGRVLLSRVDPQAATDAERTPCEPTGGLRLEAGDWATRAEFSAPGERALIGTARGWVLVLEVAPE